MRFNCVKFKTKIQRDRIYTIKTFFFVIQITTNNYKQNWIIFIYCLAKKNLKDWITTILTQHLSERDFFSNYWNWKFFIIVNWARRKFGLSLSRKRMWLVNDSPLYVSQFESWIWILKTQQYCNNLRPYLISIYFVLRL